MNIDDRLRDLLNDTSDDLAIRPAGSGAVAAAARRRSARNRMVAGTAAVMAVGGLAITGTLIGSRGEPEPDIAIAPVDDALRTEAAEEPFANNEAAGTEADQPAAKFATVTKVATSPTGDQLAAVGDLTGDGVFGLWLSGDGLTWNLAAAPVPEDGSFLNALAVTDDLILAGGTDADSVPLLASTSDGGATWQRSTLPVTEGSVTGVVAGPAGVVVSVSGTTSSTLWSADGLTFAADGVAPQTEGELVSVATDAGFVRADFSNAVSFSSDGVNWEPAAIELDGDFIGSMAARGDSVVAIGSSADGSAAAAWRSIDGGATWVVASELVAAAGPPDSPTPPALGSIAGAEIGFAVISTAFDTEGLGTSSVLSSADGVTWTATPIGQIYEPLGTNAAYPAGLAIADDLLVIAAGETAPDGATIITWIVNPFPA